MGNDKFKMKVVAFISDYEDQSLLIGVQMKPVHI